MTQLVDRPVAAAADVPVGASVVAVADTFIELMRTFGRARAKMLAAAAHDVEWSAHVVLKGLQHGGPMRAGALAEYLHSDPSTISRQVAALVKEGLLERRADPADGRASLLVLTDRADDVLADHDRIRLEYFDRMLSDWSHDELTEFAGMLRRFTTSYENANTEWITQRIANRPVASEGNHE